MELMKHTARWRLLSGSFKRARLVAWTSQAPSFTEEQGVL